ncbi:PREDICTED: endogenous retrovirus group K member 9 Gag polyprotein-like [Lepidothrix coronata]|uniref:Gag polyprotein n=1 Tax=Lepidothrix coronata TaxID=321398 RepID=A0A6J0I742_9PASS|nr:PREDICTED: endogenous retrovirus group K member 9 Gag polyprotein-like [Lepidothrix coronata]
MGSKMSSEQKTVYKQMKCLLKQHELEIEDPSLQNLLLWALQNHPELNVTNVFDDVEWDLIGVRLSDSATKGDKQAASLLGTWRAVFQTLKSHTAKKSLPSESVITDDSSQPPESAAEEELAPPPIPPVPSAREGECQNREGECQNREGECQNSGGSSAPLSQNNSKVPTTRGPNENSRDFNPFDSKKELSLYLPDPHDRWAQVRQEAAAAGDIEMLKYLPHPPRWENIPYQVLKELQKSVTDHGLTVPFTMGRLEIVFDSFTLIPLDCKAIARMILTALQFSIFKTEWEYLAARAAAENATSLNNLNNLTAQPIISMEMLLGTGPFATRTAQAQLPIHVLNEAKRLAFRALREVPEAGTARQSFVTILQGPRETFMEFTDRLKDAIDKQVGNGTAREILLEHFAIKNANIDCQKILRALQNPTISEMLRACQNVGSQSHEMTALAEALSALKGPSSSQLCYGCGQPGHFRKQCPNKKPTRQPGLCLRYRKGFHYTKKCRSEFTQEGKPLPPQGGGKEQSGNFKVSASGPHAMTASAPEFQPNHLY